jgi:molybdopterin synthase catalytic subunit
MDQVRLAQISAERLDVTRHLAAVDDPTAGAVASFIGVVRDHDPDTDQSVVGLQYSAHPDAEATLLTLIRAAIGSADARVAVSHRVGDLLVGDVAVVIVVATPHRDEAFTFCRAIIEAIKRELPVWKRQLTADGAAMWKGIGG